MLPSDTRRQLTPTELAMLEARRERLKRIAAAAAAKPARKTPTALAASLPAQVTGQRFRELIYSPDCLPFWDEEILAWPVIPETRPTVNIIKKAVAEHFGLDAEQLEGKSRLSNLVYPRQIAIYFTRKMTLLSLMQIGSRFGDRDHTTILHAEKQIEKLVITNPDKREEVAQIQLAIEAAL